MKGEFACLPCADTVSFECTSRHFVGRPKIFYQERIAATCGIQNRCGLTGCKVYVASKESGKIKTVLTGHQDILSEIVECGSYIECTLIIALQIIFSEEYIIAAIAGEIICRSEERRVGKECR